MASKYKNTDKDNKYSDEEEDINIREIIFYYLNYWKWFLASIIIFMTLGTLFYMSKSHLYEISTSVLVKEDPGKGSNGSFSSLESLGLISTTNNVENEIAVLSSPNLIRQTVDSLGLYKIYLQKKLLRTEDVYKACPYTVDVEGADARKLKGSVELDISYASNGFAHIKGKYTIKEDEYEFKEDDYKLPCSLKIPSDKGRVIVDLRPTKGDEETASTSSFLEDDYVVRIVNIQSVVNTIASSINVEAASKYSSVLNITLQLGNSQKATDFLSKIVELYNKNNVLENNQVAIATSNFVNERLRDISTELKSVENNAVNFMKQKGITNVEAETQAFLEQNADIEQKRVDAETQLKLVELVENYVNQEQNKNKLIPNLGITDQGLASVITEYNSTLLTYDRIERSTSKDSPARIRVESNLKNMRQNIQSAILNVKKAMNINKKDLTSQSNKLASRKQDLPEQEYGLTEILRQQQVIQAVYIFLMQTREETNISMVATSDKAKVITDPTVSSTPVSPQKMRILLIFFILGLIIPVIVIYLRDLLFKVNIESKEELEKLAIPSVIGEIMKSNEDKTLVVQRNSTSSVVELFRLLRNNLHFILDKPEKKVILITSTIPNEGKSFVSINLAGSFALYDKKILLIGADIRNPQLATDMQFKKGKGLTSYLVGDDSWESLICNLPDFPNLDILQAGVIPPNPNELLMKPSLGELFEKAREKYDYILVDSAPLGVVSDTFLIAKHTDITIYVTREKVTPKEIVSEFINSVYKEKRLSDMYLVLNDVDDSNRNKRYGHKYKYGYGYEYKYSQEENSKKK